MQSFLHFYDFFAHIPEKSLLYKGILMHEIRDEKLNTKAGTNKDKQPGETNAEEY